MADFAHLHVHSELSLLDGYARVPDLVAHAREQGYGSLALTDHGVMYAAIDFYKACKDAEIKPIVGVEAYVAPNTRFDKRPKIDTSPYHLVLLAKDLTGYKNLIQLTTKAHTEGFYYRPRIDRELLEQHHEGLICLSACLAAELPRLLRAGDMEQARKTAEWYRDLFGPESYYLELQEHDMPEQTEVNRGLIELARALDLPLVATNDVHYVRPEDQRGQDLLLCIQTNSQLDDPNRMRMGTNTFYLRSSDEMQRLFAELPASLDNTLRIAEQCDLKLDFGRLHLPEIDLPPGQTVDSYLEQLCRDGLQRRVSPVTTEYEQRLRYELDVVRQTGFAQYILIVWDIFRYARERGVIAGPRGSAAGALVLYLLGISDVDPVEHRLTFERFLNPERAEMPDVDMDFADDRRDEMINYVTDKYGRDCVAQIITFGTLGAKAAIRDTGRALGLSFGEVDRVAKLVPTLPVGITIDGAIEANPLLRGLIDEDEAVGKLIDDARRVEGFARHASTHAAGVVIAREPLTEYTPLQATSRNDTNLMTQYNADNLAKIGLLKMDFLGLSNLTILGRAVEIVAREHGRQIDLLKIPFDDPKAFELFGKGETVGLFQLEGRGMTAYLRELKPETVADITAMIALYRPGPMANIPQYIARKNGRERVSYPHPLLQDILEDTYGVLTYQDQVLLVLQKVAGYTLGQADIVRKAMGKKIRALMEKEKVRFAEGCGKNGVSEEDCEALWDLLEPFSGYGFNRAHAACYAQIAYQTAYLKANYPAAFMTAVLSTFRDNSDKVTGAIVECRRMGIAVLPPNVNASQCDFSIERQGEELAIRYGLAAVKNVGEQAAQPIVDARQKGGRFVSVDDFTKRVDLRGVNKRVLESLVKAGAMDDLGERGRLLASLDRMVSRSLETRRAAETGQSSLFDLLPAAEIEDSGLALQDAPELPEKERLGYEKELLGVYFSEHPMSKITRALEDEISCYCSEVGDEFVGRKVTIAGVVASLRQLITKKKDAMATAVVEDAYGSVEVVAFPRVYAETRDLWRENQILIVEGKVEPREERFQVVVDAVREFDPDAPASLGPTADVEPPPDSDDDADHAIPIESNGHSSNGAAVREQVVIGPQARGATQSNGNGNGNGRGGNGRNGNGKHEPEPFRPPVPTGPPKLVRIAFPRSGDETADSQRLRALLDVLDAAEVGVDDVRVELPCGPTTVELHRPGRAVRFGAILRKELRRLQLEDAVRVEGEESLAAS